MASRATRLGGTLGLGLAGVLLGIGAAVLLALTQGGGGTPVVPTGSTAAIASGSAAPSGSLLVPSASTPPSMSPTDEPTATATATEGPQPTKTPQPTPTPNTNPTIVSFDAPKTEDCTNASAGTIQLSWTIVNATGVTLSIDGPGPFASYPGLTQTVEVPFGCDHSQLDHTYTLTTTGGSGLADKVTRTVTARAPRIKTFTLGPAACPSASGSVGIALSYEIVAATGAELKRDGAVYTTYSGKLNDDIVQFDCAKASQTFRLTTTGGFGEADTMKIVVNRSLP